MPLVLVLAPLHPPRAHGEVRGEPLQRLDPRLLVGADEVNALLSQSPGLLIGLTDRSHLLGKRLRVLGVSVQPVAAAVRLQLGLLLKNAPRSVGRCRTRCAVSSPRRPTPGRSSGRGGGRTSRAARRRRPPPERSARG